MNVLLPFLVACWLKISTSESIHLGGNGDGQVDSGNDVMANYLLPGGEADNAVATAVFNLNPNDAPHRPGDDGLGNRILFLPSAYENGDELDIGYSDGARAESEMNDLRGGAWDDIPENYRVSPSDVSNFTGFRDKKFLFHYPLRYIPKRAPTGFMGMRGKKQVGEYKRIPTGFTGVRGKKSYSKTPWNGNSNGQGQGAKRAPTGFLGMRGKKSMEEIMDPLYPALKQTWDERYRTGQLSGGGQMEETSNFLFLDPTPFSYVDINRSPPKRVPTGFMGLRGKKDCC